MKQIFALVVAFTITTTAFSQAGQKWSTSGNANSNGDFIGSTNNQPLIFKTNNTIRGLFTSTGSFQLTSLAGLGFSLLQTDASGTISKFPMSNANEILYGDGVWRPLPTPPPSTWELNGTSLYYLNGKVGIGTKTPFTNFDVIGDAYISNNLYVGGGIIITEKINANKEVLTSTLRADSIIMDSTKAVYGYSVFKDEVRLENKLRVVGNTQIDGNFRINGDFIFGNNKRIGYLPPSGGNPEVISFGGLPQLPSTPCFAPVVTAPTVNQFKYMLQAWGYSNGDEVNGNINVLAMGYDGANGIIDMRGQQSNGDDTKLLINWYCGKDVGININPANAGNVTMTSATMGMVGIGTTPSTKLDVNGQITMRTGAQNGFIPVSDGSGKMTWTNPATITTSSLWQSNSSGIYFNTGGNVGIGTTSFGGKLAIEHSFDNNGNGRANHIYLTDPTNVKIKGYIGINKNTAAGIDKEYLSIQAVEENEHWMNIVLGLNGGNVGIGTDNPTAKLDVFGNIRTNYNQILLTADDYHGLGWFQTHAGEVIDGPVLYGYSGGALAIKQGTTTTKNILTWKQDGSVNINTNNGTPDIKAFTISDEGTGVNVFRVMSSGHAYATELTVKLKGEFPDYVFSKQYALLPLNELANYISKHQHLPNIPNAKEVNENGLSIGEMQVKQMEKIEELTLYILELNKRLTSLEEENKTLKENK